MDLLEDFFVAVRENNKPLSQEKFEILLINHEVKNIYFPGCSFKVFIKNYPKPSIKENLSDDFEKKYMHAVYEIKSFFFEFGPYLSYSQAGLLFHYNLRKFEYLENLYMLERNRAFISFDSQKKHEEIFERFYDENFSDSLQISMIYREMVEEISNQKYYLKYIEEKYGIKTDKLYTTYSMKERSGDAFINRQTTLKQILLSIK
ncbi:hypothetical protein OAF16_03545 [Flavobacteriales bacterium]|nr:hypothetical protein [Flavobacteriales bacterium]